MLAELAMSTFGYNSRMDDVSAILDGLNDAQREAVGAPPTHMRVLAGAGSGKTRVLIHRIAWLIGVEGVSPQSILAVTFTNKAAGEMRARLEPMLRVPARAMWVGTFHGIAHRLLRLHYKEAKLPQAFQIIDSDDQLRLVKRVMRGLEMDEQRWPPRQMAGFINSCKEDAERPADLADTGDYARSQMIRVYTAYESAREAAGLVDFPELLLRAYETCRDNAELLAHYRRRFTHLMVDEFQDTNALQYAWVKLLAGTHGKVFIVGDDDQSIYSWRGARVDNILRFEDDFAGTQTVRLEQNYRSTGTILAAANGLIGHNLSRLGKELWTAGAEGEPIDVYAAYNEYDEAQHVVTRIQNWIAEGGARSDVAILYRSNAQSRVLEERLIAAEIPYRIYGGQKFFERAEIKDALAYLRLIQSRSDDAAFERIVNTPTRGIGNTTVDKIRTHARASAMNLWQAAYELAGNGLAARAAKSVMNFIALIDELDASVEDMALHEATEHVIAVTDLKGHHGKGNDEKAEARKDNLDELVSAARAYTPDDDETMDEITQFLAYASLEAGEAQAGEWDDSVQLMTLHAAKGLEFPLVFMVGLEEGLFPHQRSVEDDNGLEEERRLAYVGMTRAMEKLNLSHAEVRRLHGQENLSAPSRFLREIPSEHLRETRPQAGISQPVFRPGPIGRNEEKSGGLGLGQRVVHKKFGEGTVLAFEGDGARARIQVNFDRAGSKWLIAGYAKLDPI
ncbi:DNA-dependent ATPase I and helicase II [Salinisphaera hydrothermalis C41B8]|uniref:DNA 3'-5' helicase n=2 Tax=Salinisphaera TaxID=180541 RepID=A0A084IGF1_SALHC|nr:DNA-dependent ATPase I and helicase II [Salinisphaera hydrothermalis C41B8]